MRLILIKSPLMHRFLRICLLLAGFSVPAGSIAQLDSITLYSDRHYESDEVLFDRFTEITGIRVNVVKAGADGLIERLKAEGANTKADVLITADAGRLERAKSMDLLQPIVSETLEERIPENLRDPERHWFGFTQRSRILAYAKDRVKPDELSTYEDLASEKWKGRLLARSSANIYNQSLLASIIAADGEEAALAWAKAVRGNMARPPQGSDRDQMRAVAAGLGDVAIVNTYYVGLLANSSSEKDREVAEKLGIFFPNQDGRGAHVNVSGGGVTKHAPNPGGGLKFLEFMVSAEAQSSFPEASYEYPVVDSVEWAELQRSWGKFKADDLNLSTLGELNETAVRLFNRAGWE